VACVIVAACSTDADTNTPTDPSDTVGATISEPTPVIVDYSPTVSDVGALMYLLVHPHVEVIAVSLPVTGEAGCELGIEVTLGILALFDSDAPVACDSEIPVGAKSWPPAFLTAQENLLFRLPKPTSPPSELTGPNLIARAASDAGRPVVLLAVAPLTNVARALNRHPDLREHLERIVIMGGAVDVAGNVEGTDSEWNLWIDAKAAAAVIASGVPITVIPLDATNDVPVPHYGRILDGAPESDALAYLDRLLRSFPAVTSGFFYLWDELAASIAAGEEHVVTEQMKVTVLDTGPDAGQMVRDDTGALITVATGVPDPRSFYADFLGTLAGAPVDVGRLATPEEAAYLRSVDDSLADLEEAFTTVFSESETPEQAGLDGITVADAAALIMSAIVTSHDTVADLNPPASLEEVHDNFLRVFGEVVGAQDAILLAAAEAETFDDIGPAVDVNIADACQPVTDEAAWLGVDIDLPC
jgi:pyrimidine-specific ribonucleoside hydrolase